ncbi:MAG: DUF5671 domain-containing protein [Candidatus Baltobacteraceae bacterium]
MASNDVSSNANDEVLGFIRSAKEHGVADDFIVAMLRQNGWSERRAFGAFSAYYADVLDVAPPTRAQHPEHARDAFLYLLNFLTLGFWTVALGQIWYLLIARWFPDASQYTSNALPLRDEISWQVATVVVTFPIFFFVHSLIRRSLQRRPDLYDSGVRRWLTYLALVAAAVIVVTDAVWFVGAFLRGELSARFLLDSLVLFVLGGGVFAYYLLTIDPPVIK